MTLTAPLLASASTSITVPDLLERARLAAHTDLPGARALVQQARVLAHAEGDGPAESEALYLLAEICYASGLTNDAFAVALESKALARSCGAVLTEVSALNLIAAVQYHSANFSEALASGVAALELYRTTGERTSEGMLLNSLAVIQHSLHDTDRALVTYEAALMANKGEPRPDLDAITLANMAKVRADRHEELLAVSLGETALELARDHAPEFVPEILARLASAYVALSTFDRAGAVLDHAEGILRDRTDRSVALSPLSLVMVRIAHGELSAARGDSEGALAHWAEALDLATATQLTEMALELHHRLASLYKQLDRFAEALQHQEARYELHRDIIERGADMRIKTIQIQHDMEIVRLQTELLAYTRCHEVAAG